MHKLSALKKGILGYLAVGLCLLGVGAVQMDAPQPAAAQSAYFQHLSPRTYANGGSARAMDTTTTTDPSSDVDYTDVFNGVTSQVQAAATGPGKLAIGVMLIGVIFSVVVALVIRSGKMLKGR